MMARKCNRSYYPIELINHFHVNDKIAKLVWKIHGLIIKAREEILVAFIFQYIGNLTHFGNV